jgi:hypothetical protein
MRKIITKTPRDLFKPPPQALFFSNVKFLDELRDKAFELWDKSCYDEQNELLRNIVQILEDHEERLGRPS